MQRGWAEGKSAASSGRDRDGGEAGSSAGTDPDHDPTHHHKWKMSRQAGQDRRKRNT